MRGMNNNTTSPPGGMPRYLPHMCASGVLQMGLSRLETRQWIENDSDIAAQHRFKRALAARDFAAVFGDSGMDPGAGDELLATLESHLLADHSSVYRCRDGALHCIPGAFTVAVEDGPALWRASLLIADDLALMVDRDGAYHLAAASLCSPSHWRLADKLGRPMREVHDPIPGVHDDLSPRIDRFLAHLRTDAPVQRCNWSLQFGDQRFCPGRGSSDPSWPLYYRVERQTLRRLAKSGAIAFTIRVYLHSVASLRAIPGAQESLLRCVQTTPEDIARYKGFPRYLEALRAEVARRD
jgi:hypothetical protein